MEKTDVVGAMEAIEEAQSPLPSKEKDKSPWRKSNLNVSNSSEATQEPLQSVSASSQASASGSAAPSSNNTAARRIRRLRSRSNIEPGQVVQAVQGLDDEPLDESSRRSSLIQTLGQDDGPDTLKLYIRRPSQEEKTAQGKEGSGHEDNGAFIVEDSPRRGSAPAASTLDESPSSRSEQLIQKYRHSVDVSADILRSIEEAESSPERGNESGRREKRIYQRTMTPSSLRSALQQRLKDNLQSAHLVGTIRSLGDDAIEKPEEEEDEEDEKKAEEDEGEEEESRGEDQKLLPPSIPKHLRRPSRDENKLDKIDIDSENIETPPVTRRAFSMRSFRSPSDSRWLSSKKEEEAEDFDGRRAGRRFRSLTSEDRRALVGEKKGAGDGEAGRNRTRTGVDSSENEGAGSEIEERGSARRTQRFKRLADLAKDGDSETEQMLAKQKERSMSIDDDGLGDGHFERFSSVRKTLRHKKMQDRPESRLSEDNAEAEARREGEGSRASSAGRKSHSTSPERHAPQEQEASVEKIHTKVQQAETSEVPQESYEDKDSRLKRWQRIKDSKTDEDPSRGKSRDTDSWKDRITRRFRSNVDKYDVQRAMEDRGRGAKGDLKPPASERLHRKNQDSVAKGLETRGSFRVTSSASDSSRRDRRDRTRSAIDPSHVRQALDKEKEKDKKRSVFGDSSRGVSRLFSKLDAKEPTGLRRGETRTRSLMDPHSKTRLRGSTTKEVDEGFEDTGSIKSETTSQGASSTGDVPDGSIEKVPTTPSSLRRNRNGLRIDSLRGRQESSLGASKKAENSGSRSSLRSSRSSLTSAASVNTVRPARPPSKSPSTTSMISNKSDSSSRKGKMTDYTSALKSLTLKSLRMGRGGADDYEGTQSSPCSPKGENAQPSFPDDRTRSSGSLHSSGGATPTRSLSRADSTRSTGSLSKQSSEGSLRRGTASVTRAAAPSANSSARVKRPLAPAQVRSLTSAESRHRNISGSNTSLRRSPGSTPTSSVKVKRGDSGSSKENLSRSNSGNSRVGGTSRSTARSSAASSSKPLAERSASFRSSPPKPEGTQSLRRPVGTPAGKPASARKGGNLPAFMRPTTSSSSKVSAGDAPAPVKKVKVVSRNLSLSSPRTMVK